MNRKLLLPLLGQPDPNAPKDVHLVGRYAVGVTWGDDHGSIYPFEGLRRACACGSCGDTAAFFISRSSTQILRAHGNLEGADDTRRWGRR